MNGRRAPALSPVGEPTPGRAGQGAGVAERRRLEEDLLRMMQRLDAHITNSPLAVIEFDTEFRVIRWSEEAVRLFGWSPEEILGRSISEVRWVHEDDEEQVRRVSGDLFSGRRSRFLSVNRNYRKDGSVMVCEWYNSAIYDSRGRLVSVLSQVLDVTERTRTEESLRASLERLKIAQQAAKAGFWDWDMTAGTLTWSPELFQLFGLPESAEASFATWLAVLHPDDREPAMSRINRAIEDRVQLHNEYRIVLPGGEERWIAAAGDTHYDAAGRPQRMVGICIDISARKQAEQRLKQLNAELERRVATRTADLRRTVRKLDRAQRALEVSEAKYRGLAENTKDILYSADASGVISYIGPQVVRYGWTPDEIIGRRLLDFVAPDDRGLVAGEMKHAFSTGESRTLAFRMHAKDGREYWMEEAGDVRHGGRERGSGMVGVLRDVTERKESERIRAEQEQRLRRLAAKLASAQDEEQRRIAEGLHDDVAQLLAVCSVKLGVAAGTSDPIKLRALLDTIDAHLRDADQKVRLLSFELASSTLHRLGLQPAIQELCDSMAERYGVRFEIGSEPMIDRLDAAAATVVFKAARELLFNVVKHAGVKQARVRLGEENRELWLTVEDHGRGFACATAGGRGSPAGGLGLFGIEERLKDLGGTMQIESLPNVCTRVTLRVPFRARRGRRKPRVRIRESRRP